MLATSKKFSNFYDWFCDDGDLQRRARNCEKAIDRCGIRDKFDDSYTYDFKNCCPMSGNLYDVVRVWNAVGDLVYLISRGKPQKI